MTPDRKDYLRYFEILELPPDATLHEVNVAYRHLKDLYSGDSIVTSPLSDEFPDDDRVGILDEIDEAYRRLTALFEEEAEAETDAPAPSPLPGSIAERIAGIEHFSGPVLREIREKMDIGLEDIALATKIRMKYLEYIEADEFEHLPPEVFTRGFVKDYARFLSLDPERVARDYIENFRKWQEDRAG